MAENPDDGRLVCMVCGGLLGSSGPAAARQHILQQHAHSLDFTLEEKHNILEGWSEGAVLPEIESSPSSAGNPLPALRRPLLLLLLLRCPRGSGQPTRWCLALPWRILIGFLALPTPGGPGENQQPAEIEVLLDLEEQPVSRKRGPVPARCGEC